MDRDEIPKNLRDFTLQSGDKKTNNFMKHIKIV